MEPVGANGVGDIGDDNIQREPNREGEGSHVLQQDAGVGVSSHASIPGSPPPPPGPGRERQTTKQTSNPLTHQMGGE